MEVNAKAETSTNELPKPTLQTQAIDTASGLLSSFRPVKQICMHFCAFHAYAHDTSRQVQAEHYCTHYFEDVHQCLIYDTDGVDARLIGVEYVITERVFAQLPEEEKKYWHFHGYEVQSGMLVTPELPFMMQDAQMRKLANTYGKTWHFWQVDHGDPLPYGEPQLMTTFFRDGALNPELLGKR